MRAFVWVLAAAAVAFSGCVVRGNSCPAGYVNCGDYCADLSSDPLDCGGCGAACAIGDYCSRGVCVVGSCVADGYGCRYHEDCCSGYCASDLRCGCMPPGYATCYSNVDCCSNYCGQDGFCR